MKSGGTHGQKTWRLLIGGAAIGFVALLFILLNPVATFAATGAGPDWTTYQTENGRSGDNNAETIISPSSAPNLKLQWIHTAAGSIVTQPVVANGLIYWGSWDRGYEHATDLNNNHVWTYETNTSQSNNCNPSTVGVSSTSTIATVTINGVQTPVDFFGGGTAVMNAVNAQTGKLIWDTNLGSPPAHFIWSSSAVYNGNVYIGIASLGDCPLVQGQEVELNAATGQIEHTFDAVPNGCVGAGIWSSATIDPSGDGGAGALYFDTGNGGNCSQPEPYSYAMVELSLSTLSVVGSWQVPTSQRVDDSDFGATPTLFTANGQNMVGAVNKNGLFYAFNRDNLNSGPAWTMRVSNGGDCPQCGSGDITTAAWDGSTLYVGGGAVTIGVKACKGNIDAINPNTQTFIWQHCMGAGPVLGPVITANGVVADGQGNVLMVLNATTGATLFRYADSSGSPFYGGPTISHGIIYIGNMDGNLYSFNIPSSVRQHK